MTREVHEQIEFLRRQVHGFSGEAHRALLEVDLQVAGIEHGLGAGLLLGQAVHAAEDRLHPRGQLEHAERLGQVIVGAHFEAEHAIELA